MFRTDRLLPLLRSLPGHHLHPQFPKVPLYLVVHLCRSALWLLLHRRHLLFPMDRLFPAVPKFHSDPLPLLRHLLPDFRKHRRFLMGQQNKQIYCLEYHHYFVRKYDGVHV